MAETGNTPYTGVGSTGVRYTGRTVIKLPYNEVTKDNVRTILSEALGTHRKNEREIEYLYNYYKGEQPILAREKTIRSDINNKIVENRANEIVAFKVGYLCGSPVQYTANSGDESVARDIEMLNYMVASEGKEVQDKEIVEWNTICGTAYRYVYADKPEDADTAPFEMCTLDPRQTFVAYSSHIGNKPLMACTYWNSGATATEMTYAIYTADKYYEINGSSEGGEIVEASNPLGMIPIIEYPANTARLGAFEIVLPLLDAINSAESNRLDGLEQAIQSFIKFINCEIDKDTFQDFLELGAIAVKSHEGANADVDIICKELSQQGTQTLVDNLYEAVLTICGMPNRQSSSAGDNGIAVQLRDGWQGAETRAKDAEMMFRGAEMKMLKVLFRILSEKSVLKLKVADIGLKFTRRNYEAIQSKSQVLVSMLQSEKIHPRLAFEHCGMFPDPETAYSMSADYYEEQMKKWEPIEVDESNNVQES